MAPDDDEVLTLPQFYSLLTVSPSTGKRILKSPGAPPVLHLSARRRGIRRGDARAYQQRCLVVGRKA
jgi:hypothetical protein